MQHEPNCASRGATIVLLVVALSASCSSHQECNLQLSGPPTSAVSPTEGYYCTSLPSPPPSARVQILVDSSGSMNGFRGAMPAVESWIRQGISTMNGAQISLNKYRGCYFNKRIGISECNPDLGRPLATFHPVADTNLDQAIDSAAGYDLTFILTDGVAFTGSGRGDCVGGVDSACVARTLKNVLKTYEAENHGAPGGLWLLPLMTHFDGIYYSAQSVRSQDFHRGLIRDQVQQDVSNSVSIEKPRNGSDGELIYDYHGPKVLFTIILGKNPGLGRAALLALSQSMEMKEIHQVQKPSDWHEGVAALPPIEIFPGTLPYLHWRAAENSSEMNSCGPIEFSWRGEEQTIQLHCRDQAAQILVTLPIQHKESPSACITIKLLAPLDVSLDQRTSRGLLTDYRLTSVTRSMNLLLSCPSQKLQPGVTEVYRWNARPNYKNAADCLAQPQMGGCPKGDLLSKVDTIRPAEQPQRGFGIAAAVKLFYEDAGDMSVNPAFADLRVTGGH